MHSDTPDNLKIKKDITICFRASPETHSYLKFIAKQQRVSISHVIKSAIFQFQKNDNRQVPSTPDRRQHARKTMFLPALIGERFSPPEEFFSGLIIDFSLGGISFSVSKSNASKIQAARPLTEYSIIFHLPGQSQPLTVRCIIHNFQEDIDHVRFHAAFSEDDSEGRQSVQDHFDDMSSAE